MAFIGIEGKARPVSQVYVGVNGVARLVTAAYIGVNGIAQPWLGSNSGDVVGDIPMLAPGRQWFKHNTLDWAYGNVEIVDSYEPNGNEYASWAADVDGTGSIMCYVYKSGGYSFEYDKVIIAGNGSGMIAANSNSVVAFARTMGSNCNFTVTGLNLLDTRSVVNMDGMLAGITNDISAQIRGWKTGTVNNMLNLFEHCSGITTLDLSGWDVSQVTNLDHTFAYCSNLTTLNLTGWNTARVEEWSYLFRNCSKLEEVIVTSGKWTLDSGSNEMFYQCGKIDSLTYV